MQHASRDKSSGRRSGATAAVVGTLAALLSGLLAGCLGDSAQDRALRVETLSTLHPTQGAPFAVLIPSPGTVLVSVSNQGNANGKTGIEIFEKSALGLKSKCINDKLSATVDGVKVNVTSVMGMALFPGASDFGAAIENSGFVLLGTDDVATCSTPLARTYVAQSTDNSSGTFDLVITRDGQYAFAANEYGVVPDPQPQPPSSCPGGPSNSVYKGNVGVTKISRNPSGSFSNDTALEWQLSTGGCTVAGILLSKDGKRLYVTSELAGANTKAAGADNPLLGRTGCIQKSGSNPQRNGLLTVIDVDAARSGPGPGVILATIAAGCSPVRMTQTADGKVLWVTARGDNRVLAFSTARLESDPGNALIGHADTGGQSPVGLALFHGDRLLAVANSDRFTTTNPNPNATILDVTIPESPQLVHTLATGDFPRNIAVGPDDATLYLTNFDSSTLQVIETSVQ